MRRVGPQKGLLGARERAELHGVNPVWDLLAKGLLQAGPVDALQIDSCRLPKTPRLRVEFRAGSLAEFAFSGGRMWRSR